MPVPEQPGRPTVRQPQRPALGLRLFPLSCPSHRKRCEAGVREHSAPKGRAHLGSSKSWVLVEVRKGLEVGGRGCGSCHSQITPGPKEPASCFLDGEAEVRQGQGHRPGERRTGSAWGLGPFTSVHKPLQAPALGLVLGWVLGTQSCPKPGLSLQGALIKW